MEITIPTRNALALAVALVLYGCSQPDARTTSCRAVDMPLESIYSVSATQTPQGDLLILDYRFERLVKMDLRSGRWGAIEDQAAAAMEGRRPVAVRRLGEYLLLEQSSPAMFIELDGNLGIHPIQPHRIVGVMQSTGHMVDALWIWEPAGKDLVACGDIYLGSGDERQVGNWRSGFVRIPISEPATFFSLLEFDINDRTALGCRLAMPLIAPAGDRAYMLSLDETPRIFVGGTAGTPTRPLAAFPERFAFFPNLPSDPSRQETSFVFGKFEAATMPAGLFVWEGALYLLSRSPGSHGGTDWWLTKIDLEHETLLGTIEIGSHANHLMVVPGDQYWALIEKGPVNSFLDQELSRVLVLSADVIRSWNPEEVLCGMVQSRSR